MGIPLPDRRAVASSRRRLQIRAILKPILSTDYYILKTLKQLKTHTHLVIGIAKKNDGTLSRLSGMIDS